ncbi:MAG: hypothetical protein ACJ8C4_21405 [Gemmataceae bacterium]
MSGLVQLARTTAQPANESHESELRKLLQYKVELRRKMFDVLNSGGKAVPEAELAAAKRQVMEAELDAAETKAQRIAILQKLSAFAKANFEAVQNLESKIELIRAEVEWTEAVIALEREKLK